MTRGIRRIVLYSILLMCTTFELKAQPSYLSESFKLGVRPASWTEETVEGSVPWRYRNGGYNPADPNLLAPSADYDPFRHPNKAYNDTYNAWFFC